MSAQRPDTPSGGRAVRRTARPADAAEPMAPGSQRPQSPAVRQQQTASDGSPRQPGSQDAHREQYGQQAHADGSGQPSQFGGVPPQQHAGHAGGGSNTNRPRSGGTQDPRHAEEDDYAAPWGVYGGEYGQFDRSPGRRQAFGQQDLGFGRGPSPDSPRGGEPQAYGPGASQPWRGNEEGAHWRGRPGASDDSVGWGSGRGQPYAPGRYGASAAGGPQGDDSDHDSQGSQDWQGYSGGRGWQPGPREGGSGQWDRQAGRSGYTPSGGPGRERSQDAGGAQGAWRGEAGGYGGGRHDASYGGGAQQPDTHGGAQQGERWNQGRMQAPLAEDAFSAPAARGRAGPGADGGMPVRDPSHDWGTSDAQPWRARQQGHDDGDDRGDRHDPRWGGPSRSFDNPYGRRDQRGDQPLGEYQGSPYAGSRRGGIGSRAGAASGGWDPSEHHGGHYGTQGFGGSGRGGPGWSTPPGAGQPDHPSGHPSQNRAWDEPRSRQADRGPASWQAQSRGSGWRGEPGSGPSGDRDDEPDRHSAWPRHPGERHAGGAGWGGDEAQGQGTPRHRQAHDNDRAAAHHDPDYHQWRAEQLRNFDDDYHQWRQERYRRFSDEFNEWRQGRMRGAPSPASGSSGQASQPDDLPGFRPPSAGAGAGSAPAAAGAGQPGSAHDVGVSGSTHAGSHSDPQGAAQGTTLPSSGGESRELTGTSGGTSGGSAATKGADRGLQGDKPDKAKER